MLQLLITKSLTLWLSLWLKPSALPQTHPSHSNLISMFSLFCFLNCPVHHCKNCNLELGNFAVLSHSSLSIATGSATTVLNWINHFVRASLVKCIGLTHAIQKLLMQYYTALSCGAKRKLPKRIHHLTENSSFVEEWTIVWRIGFFCSPTHTGNEDSPENLSITIAVMGVVLGSPNGSLDALLASLFTFLKQDIHDCQWHFWDITRLVFILLSVVRSFRTLYM